MFGAVCLRAFVRVLVGEEPRVCLLTTWALGSVQNPPKPSPRGDSGEVLTWSCSAHSSAVALASSSFLWPASSGSSGPYSVAGPGLSRALVGRQGLLAASYHTVSLSDG